MSFFSRSSTKSAASSVHSLAKGKEVPEPTSKIFTTPPEGITPKKKWEYNEEQLAKVRDDPHATPPTVLHRSIHYHIRPPR
jgi:hypothetical protein